MLVPTNYKTFLQYASQVFIPYIRSQPVNIQRTYVVWDRFFRDNLKSQKRNNQGSRVFTNIFSNGKIPNIRTAFLSCSDNKSELFPFHQLNYSVKH